MNNIMVDLETMSTSSQAAIISIGAIYFDAKEGLGKEFYCKVSLASCMKAGLEVDAPTIIWWLQQAESARKEFFDNDKADSLEDALTKLSEFIEPGCQIWGNGPAFDNAILQSAYRLLGKKLPWKYSNDRCFRTIKELFPGVAKPPKSDHHNALADAKWQAQYYLNMFKAANS